MPVISLEDYRNARGWPEIPEDPNDLLLFIAQNQITFDQDLLLYLWARSAGAL